MVIIVWSILLLNPINFHGDCYWICYHLFVECFWFFLSIFIIGICLHFLGKCSSTIYSVAYLFFLYLLKVFFILLLYYIFLHRQFITNCFSTIMPIISSLLCYLSGKYQWKWGKNCLKRWKENLQLMLRKNNFG